MIPGVPEALASSLGVIVAAAEAAAQTGNFHGLCDIMLHDLETARASLTKEAWLNVAIPWLRSQRFYELTQEDPVSSHAVKKPRGYPGDALLVDFLYRSENVRPLVDKATSAGRAICEYWVQSPAACAVRARKDWFSQQITEVAERKANARVFVIASGHFREGESSLRQESTTSIEVVCLDQDPLSCDFVRGRGDRRVRVLNDKIKSLFTMDIGRFDLIYSAGLYDYLPDHVAIRLNQSLVRMLAPGGRIVVPNFLIGAQNRASMELLQDWFLIFRDEAEIRSLLTNTGACNGRRTSYFEDDFSSVGYAIFDQLG